MLFLEFLPDPIDLPEAPAVLNGARMPSMADEVATDRSTPRARVAGSRK